VTVRVWAVRGAVYIPMLCAWELAARGAADPQRLPSPLGVAAAALENVGDGVLQTAVAQSLSRIVVAVLFATVAGLALGALMGWSRGAERALAPIVDGLRSVAPIAWIPMAILWFGITGGATIFIVAYAALFPVALNTVEAVRSTDVRLVHAARTLGAGRWTLCTRVFLPAALPTVIVGTRIGIGFAWASIVAAELALGIKLDGGTQVAVGLGQLMVERIFFEPDANELVLYMLVVGLVAILIDRAMRSLHARATPWAVA